MTSREKLEPLTDSESINRCILLLASWALITGSILIPMLPIRQDHFTQAWRPLFYHYTLPGFFLAGLIPGLGTNRGGRDRLVLAIPLLFYPLSFFVLCGFGAAGDAGMGEFFALILMPIAIIPLFLLGAITGEFVRLMLAKNRTKTSK